jgi:hypothetical protein
LAKFQQDGFPRSQEVQAVKVAAQFEAETEAAISFEETKGRT